MKCNLETFKDHVSVMMDRKDISLWAKGALLQLLAMDRKDAMHQLAELTAFFESLEDEKSVVTIEGVTLEDIERFNEGRARMGAPELDIDDLRKMKLCSEIAKQTESDPIQIIQNLSVDHQGTFYWNDKYILQQLNIRMRRHITANVMQDIFEDHQGICCKTYVQHYYNKDVEISHTVRAPSNAVKYDNKEDFIASLKDKGYLRFLQEQHHITGGVEVRKEGG